MGRSADSGHYIAWIHDTGGIHNKKFIKSYIYFYIIDIWIKYDDA